MKLYLDNAATSYPKPPEVYSSVLNYMVNIGANPGRGGHSSSLEGSRIVYKCREALMNLFNFDKLQNVIFTSNITASLNILIQKQNSVIGFNIGIIFINIGIYLLPYLFNITLLSELLTSTRCNF
jgi:selenocysteine lyase/cysteine desulfurase